MQVFKIASKKNTDTNTDPIKSELTLIKDKKKNFFDSVIYAFKAFLKRNNTQKIFFIDKFNSLKLKRMVGKNLIETEKIKGNKFIDLQYIDK